MLLLFCWGRAYTGSRARTSSYGVSYKHVAAALLLSDRVVPPDALPSSSHACTHSYNQLSSTFLPAPDQRPDTPLHLSNSHPFTPPHRSHTPLTPCPSPPRHHPGSSASADLGALPTTGLGGTNTQAAAAAAVAAGAVNGSSSTLPDSSSSGRFAGAAKAVGDCLSRVKQLSESVHRATSFRESCSRLLGAALAAGLALQEVRRGGEEARGAEVGGDLQQDWHCRR